MNSSYHSVESAWKVYTEADSSKFWKRNLYPQNVRFLVYDLEQHGTTQRQYELFKFWTGVLLLSINEMDPNILQAHRLYRMDVEIDCELLEQALKDAASKANIMRAQIRKKLEIESTCQEIGFEELPNYHIDIPVSFSMQKTKTKMIGIGDFKLTSDSRSEELQMWDMYVNSVKSEIKETVKIVDQTIGYATTSFRKLNKYPEEAVVSISDYQREVLENTLENEYGEILASQSKLPLKELQLREQYIEQDKKVRNELMRRMKRKTFLSCFIAVVTLFWATLVPESFNHNWTGIGGMALGTLAGFSFAALLFLLCKKKILRCRIREFNGITNRVKLELNQNADTFSTFFSKVASYMRGRSYLQTLEKSLIDYDSSFEINRKNLKMIESFLKRINLWAEAFHIQMDVHQVDNLRDMKEGQLNIEDLFSFEENKMYRVPINTAGTFVNSPLKFIKRISIEREEVYDDVN